jgi:hypothetical protein
VKTDQKLLEKAEFIAFRFVAFLSQDEQMFGQFLNESGMNVHDIKGRLQDHAFLGFLLDYALCDESRLLAFATNCDIDPAHVGAARRALPGANVDF